MADTYQDFVKIEGRQPPNGVDFEVVDPLRWCFQCRNELKARKGPPQARKNASENRSRHATNDDDEGSCDSESVRIPTDSHSYVRIASTTNNKGVLRFSASSGDVLALTKGRSKFSESTGQRHVRLPYKPESPASERFAAHSLAGASGLYSQRFF